MLRTLIEAVVPPAQTGAFDRFQVGFMRMYAWLMAGGSIVIGAAVAGLGQYERLLGLVPFGIVGIAGLVLLARSRLRAAAFCLVLGTWACAANGMLWNQGVAGPGIGAVFAVLILFCSWLLGSRVLLALALLTVLALLAGAVAMTLELPLPRVNPSPPLLIWLMLTVVVTIAATLGHFAARSLQDRLEGLQASEVALRAKVEELSRREREIAGLHRRYEALFRAGPAARALAVPGVGEILDCNEAYCQLLGRKREEIIGKTALQLDLWDYLEDRKRAYAILTREGAVSDFECVWRHSSGEKRNVLLQWQAVELDGEPRLLSQVIDITRLKKAEAALRESEERFSHAFHSSPECLAITRASDQQLVEVNEGFVRLTGYSRAEALGRTTTELGLWGRPAERDTVVGELLRGATVVDREVDGRDRHGRQVICRLTATFVEMGGQTFILSSMRDVTRESRAVAVLAERERELAAANRELKLQLSLHELTERVARVGHWMTDSEADRVEWSNSLCEISGMPPQPPMTFDHAASLIHIEPEDQFMALRKRLDGKPEVFHFHRPDGQVRWARVSAIAPPGDDGGKGTRVFGVVQDVTEEHEAKVALESMNVELERRVAARTAELRSAIDELDAFSYTVAHDLNAPLRSIHGFASLLQDDAAERLQDEDRTRLERIRVATSRMGELIADLLALSRVTRAEMRRERVDLTAMARRISLDLGAREPARKARWTIAEGLEANGDRGLMQVALENLLGNAWKYSRKKPEAEIEFGGNGEEHRFFVRDNGAGFDGALAGKLFKPFTRLHRESEFEGTGVGLATVHRIIQRHGGSVWAEGTPERGATFHFTVPPVRSA